MADERIPKVPRAVLAAMPDVSDLVLLTVPEVAEVMRTSRMTVYRMIKAGELAAVKFGRSYRVHEETVRRALHPTGPCAPEDAEAPAPHDQEDR